MNCLLEFTVVSQFAESRSHRGLYRVGTLSAAEVVCVHSHLSVAIYSTPRCVSPAHGFITPFQAQHHDGLIAIPGIHTIKLAARYGF